MVETRAEFTKRVSQAEPSPEAARMVQDRQEKDYILDLFRKQQKNRLTKEDIEFLHGAKKRLLENKLTPMETQVKSSLELLTGKI